MQKIFLPIQGGLLSATGMLRSITGSVCGSELTKQLQMNSLPIKRLYCYLFHSIELSSSYYPWFCLISSCKNLQNVLFCNKIGTGNAKHKG